MLTVVSAYCSHNISPISHYADFAAALRLFRFAITLPMPRYAPLIIIVYA